MNKALRFCRILLFAFIFAVCMVLGAAPVVSKRKVEIEIEAKSEETNDDEKAAQGFISKK